jgi:ABC-type bacteriocin/lantibiotic exporter with double-glycine peptidase domain
MLKTYQKLRRLLTPRERRNSLLVMGTMIALGPLEAAGVASVAPLLAVIVNPAVVQSNAFLGSLYQKLGFSDVNSFLLFLAAVVFVLVISRIALTTLVQYMIVRYSNGLTYSLSTRLLETYLQKPYVWFLNRHSVDLGKGVLSEVDEVTTGTVVPALQFFSCLVAALSVIAVLIAADPTVAALVITTLAAAYSAVYLGVRKYLRWLGRDRFVANRERYQVAIEVLAAIKEVKVSGLETAYLNRFRDPANRFARRKAVAKLIGMVPRSAFEIVAQGGLLIVLMVLLGWSGRDNFSSVVPMLGLYAFAGLRLIPALQEIYSTLAKIGFGHAALDRLYGDLVSTARPTHPPRPREVVPLPLHQDLELRGVTYAYPNATRPALADISLRIPARTTVGFVGATGAGKTSLVDVILGLLEPQRGEVLVDGTSIYPDNIRAWQRSIGYVPQNIFLADDTVSGNIAFGVSRDKIDMQEVERAARCAELHAFVVDGLPDGYQTKIGERGIRLSGGQRQRIGIARALYHDPDVLIFDEATSALDNLTEKAVMDAIRNLTHLKTILVIAHRLSTVRPCDRIFLLDRGQLKTAGTYDELLAHDAGFKKLATAAE